MEFGPAVAEDGTVACVGDDPEAGAGNRFGHLYRYFDRIERVAIALDDECAGLNSGGARSREVEVIITIRECFGAVEKRLDLWITAGMRSAKEFSLLFRKIIRILAHDDASLIGKMGSGADEDHGADALRLSGSHVQQDIAAAADSHAFTGAYSQMIEQRKNISGRFFVAKRLRKNGGAPVAAKVGEDEPVSCAPGREGWEPVLA